MIKQAGVQRHIRLFVTGTWTSETQVELDQKKMHYLRHVMRLKAGEKIFLFNEEMGEWSACLSQEGKSNFILTPVYQTRPFEKKPPEVHLGFALLKQEALHFLLEKATELGVTHLHPLVTDRTIIRHFKIEKGQQYVIEAAEQCGRLTIPLFAPAVSLQEFLKELSGKPGCLYLCDERRQAPFLPDIFEKDKVPYGLIGPEGGFSPQELNFLKELSGVKPITLAPNILRAETAAVTFLSHLQLCFLA